ncbi:protein indeterminate-domain 7-like [Primulina tabacum]|uniref:protein indeterminate-domain 7-like n=1 Tax=Primulina tabacum TaxID=48773 RepID=UPI003F59E649
MMKSLASIQQTPAEENMSNLTTASGEASVSSSNRNDNGGMYHPLHNFQPTNQPQPQPIKKKRNQPGHPDPDAEVIALSPRTLLATNRFVCEICNKGFQRDQNLQLHRRGHNLPWKLKQRTSKEIRKKVYVCPESSCVHHDPSRALGDLTGIKKHFCRKHGDKKWKCEKCSKRYAVQSDWKAHSKICGTKEYRCDCGTIFSRRDSFITHRAFCDALAEENSRNNTIPFQAVAGASHHINLQQIQSQFNNTNDLPFPIKKEQQNFSLRPEIPPWLSCSSFLGPQPIDLTSSTTPSSLFQGFQHNQDHQNPNPNPSSSLGPAALPPYHHPQPHLSATALLQKAAQMGAKGISNQCASPAGVFIRPHQTHMSAAGDPGQNITSGFGLNLSSRDEFINGLTSFGNKAAAMTGVGSSTGPGASGGDPSNNNIININNINNNDNNNKPLSSSSSSFLHEMIMHPGHPLSSSSGFDGSAFDEDINAFGGILNHRVAAKKARGGSNGVNHEGTGGNDGLTRDFLGLRHLSRSEILSLTGLSNCMNKSAGAACAQNNDGNQTQKSWQD